MNHLLPQGMANECGHNGGILIPHGGKIVSSWRQVGLLNLVEKGLELRRVLLGMGLVKG
jgi:hypothetical protein